MLELKLISAVSRGVNLAWDNLFRCVMPKPTDDNTPPNSNKLSPPKLKAVPPIFGSHSTTAHRRQSTSCLHF